MDTFFSDMKSYMEEAFSRWGVDALAAIALLIVGFWGGRILRALTRRALRRAGVDETLVPFCSGLVHYLVLAVVVVAALNLLGIQTTGLLAVLGSVGLAIGLAMKDTLSHFASGVMLLLLRPFRPGDFVDIAGTSGKVIEIGIFSTALNTSDNIRIEVPNGNIFGKNLKNFSANDIRRVDLVIGVSYDDDLGKASALIQSLLEEDGRILKDPAPSVVVGELADSSVNFLVRPWCSKDDFWSLKTDLLLKLKVQLEGAGFSLPYPQRDVHLSSPVPSN